MYTLLYLKWITNKDLLYSTLTLPNVLWQSEWGGAWRRMYTWTCMPESLHCSPETITASFVNQLCSNTEVKVKKKKKFNLKKKERNITLFTVLQVRNVGWALLDGSSLPHRVPAVRCWLGCRHWKVPPGRIPKLSFSW